MICFKCNTPMNDNGVAIKPNKEANCFYIVEPPLTNAKTLQLIACYKCPMCGHSEELEVVVT